MTGASCYLERPRAFGAAPKFIRGIDFAELSYESVYGMIKTQWHCEKRTLKLDPSVSANTAALLSLSKKNKTVSMPPACAPEAKALYETALKAMNESGI